MEKIYTVKMVPKYKSQSGKWRWDWKHTKYAIEPFGFEIVHPDSCQLMTREEAKSTAQFNNDMWAGKPKPYFGVVEVEFDSNGKPIRYGEEVH